MADLPSLRVFQYVRSFPFDAGKLDPVGRAVAGLAGGLAREGVETTVLSEGPADATLRAEEGYHIRCFANPAGDVPTTSLAPGLVEFVRAEAGRGVMTVLNGMFSPSLWAMSNLMRAVRRPFVVAPHLPHHPLVFAEAPWRRWWQFRFGGEKMMLRKAVGLQLPDERSKALLRALGVKTKVFVSPLGWSRRDAPPDDALVFRENPTPARLLLIATPDVARRGIDLIADAVSRNADATLTIAFEGGGGGGNTPPGVQRLLSPRVRLAAVGERPLWELLAAHDAVVAPGPVEGFGWAPLQAMLSARPVMVSADMGIAPHVAAARCGVLVQPTVDGVRLGLADLLRRKSQFRDMGLAARAYAAKRLSWQQVARDTAIDYQTLLPEHR